jgi:FtsH-binding integral membrane protein
VLGGLARFVEEHYRGEPQTMERWGLRTYQWFAAGFVVAGLAVLSLDSPVLEGVRAGPAWWGAGLVALVYAIAMGVEFPRSNARGSRLS